MNNFCYLLACLWEQSHGLDYEQRKVVFGNNAVCLFDEQNHSLIHYIHRHITSTQHNKSTNKNMFWIILVGFLPTDNGWSCVRHPYGCGNFWVLEKAPSHGVGMQIRLRLVDGSHLAGYSVQVDGSDGCRVCFAVREYAVGVSGVRLDSCIFRIEETVLPDDKNSSKQALYHHNWGYVVTELSIPGPNWDNSGTKDQNKRSITLHSK